MARYPRPTSSRPHHAPLFLANSSASIRPVTTTAPRSKPDLLGSSPEENGATPRTRLIAAHRPSAINGEELVSKPLGGWNSRAITPRHQAIGAMSIEIVRTSNARLRFSRYLLERCNKIPPAIAGAT